MTKNYKDMGHRSEIAHKAELEDMAEHAMSDKARKQANHYPYCCDMLRKYPPDEYNDTHNTSAARLIRAQGEQLRETPAEYVARICGRSDADGPGKATDRQR